MTGRSKRFADSVALGAILFGVIAAVVIGVLAALVLRAPPADGLDATVADATQTHRFSLLGYELTHLPNRWLTGAAAWFSDPAPNEAAILDQWFTGNEDGDRKAVERLLERRLSEAIVGLELDTSLPLFGSVRTVWPPVDMDLSEPLRVLAVSPRDEVRLEQTVLLAAGLSNSEVAEIEAAIESDGQWSAWVQTVGGVALYPAFIVEGRNFQSTLAVMGHEWVHHYLGFHPLGLAYGQGSDMRTINETVADIVGDELATAAVADEWFGAVPDEAAGRERAELRETTDPILRGLRLEVDELLARGEVEAAESRMNAARIELTQLGRPFRRINQAFLAFRGGYGASPSSASPWGERLIRLRDSSDSVAAFLSLIREVSTSDAALQLTGP